MALRSIPSQRRSLATETGEKPDAAQKQDFKGQLWQSTSERVMREREEQARFAGQRNVGGGGASFALMAGRYISGTTNDEYQDGSGELARSGTLTPRSIC